MKSWLKLLCFTFVIAPLTQAASTQPRHLPNHLDSGAPGCWDLIRRGPMTADELASISKTCQDFRADYFAVIDLAKANPKDFEKKIVAALTAAKKPKAPYEAIFFAKVVHSENLRAALQKRAAVEKKLKVPFAYAQAAEFKLSGKSCDTDEHYKQKFYREICDAEDTILPVFAEIKKDSK